DRTATWLHHLLVVHFSFATDLLTADLPIAFCLLAARTLVHS
ncbi:MAG: hypothetical protein H6Q31_3334, partial [Bacteroidetes bacterium]|nr:hypothetical protein [Bacteroidota bacterium]